MTLGQLLILAIVVAGAAFGLFWRELIKAERVETDRERVLRQLRKVAEQDRDDAA